MNELNELNQYLPLIIPILVVQIALVVIALLDLSQRKSTWGPKWVWVIVILFVNLLGPLIYFLVGREKS